MIKKFLKKRWYVVAVIILVAGGVFYNTNVTKEKQQKQKVYTVKRQTLKESLSISGEVNADQKTVLRFQTSGRLSWVGVKEGDYVKKYQAIASLDQRDVKKELQKQLNDFMKTRWDLDQSREDVKDKALTDKMQRILDKAQFDLNNSIIDVELQNLAVEYSTLIAPIEGIVVRVGSPYAGVNVTPAQAEFEIVNPNAVYFSATADQADVVNLSDGKQADITLDPYPDAAISGQVKGIAFTPKAGETGTVYEVKIYFTQNNSDYRYRLGMTGDANFITKVIANVLAVPVTYIKTENGKKYVSKSEKGKIVKQTVEIGDTVDSSAQITSGLLEGDIIYD